MRQEWMSYRIAFGVFVLAQLAAVLFMQDRNSVQGLLQQAAGFGAAGFLVTPALAGLGVSRFLWGRSHWAMALAGLIAGVYALVTLQETLLLALLILGVGWVLARFGKVLSLIALAIVVVTVANGHVPGLAAVLDAAPLPKGGHWTWEVLLALAAAAVPWLSDTIASQLA